MIQHLLGIWAERISKINYSKSYVKQNEKISIQQESVLLLYCSDNKKAAIMSLIAKQYQECYCRFIAEKEL
jgi:hypothetical protein